ncbi:hypothetical protein H6L53_04825 [Staphylococcus epidermidis]|nr:hypothetical protein [Staphylococcus epidermidis]MBM6061030.1 hypothetical protein [Staphylococcus epidermidis]MBM6079001.1 hypothetical protein [Staphylococcus epidermidis]QRJ08738.1 hypothetical protein HJI07_05235 [Staphylococcus epidermidis]
MTRETFLYDYDLSTIYMLIDQYNEQSFKNKLLGREFLSYKSIEEFAQDIDKIKDNRTESDYQEVRAVEFL